MINRLLIFASLVFTAPAFAQTTPEIKTYRPFRYETACMLETGIQTYPDTCVVIETRENSGVLRTRNIFSNKFGLTIKGRFDKERGYMTWDSHNKFEYKWDYRPAGTGWTYVMPGFLVENVSWD
jgi:hypothetical protein